jgi:shikimate kinase
MNYILIGMPNSGKSTLGKKAADTLGMQFYDTDKLATDYVLSIYETPPFFEFASEILAAEEIVVQKLVKEAENAIIATGAETALNEKNVQALKNAGRFIYIKRDPDLMLKEILKKYVPDPKRPEVRNADELSVYFYRNILHQYEDAADIIVENDCGEESGLEALVKTIRAETAPIGNSDSFTPSAIT